MSDTISRQDAINKCQERLYESALNNVGYECKADEVFADIAQNRIKTWLNEVPSAQPQITHCAECIHWKHSDVRKNYCEVFDWTNKAKDFCSFAERIDE